MTVSRIDELLALIADDDPEDLLDAVSSGSVTLKELRRAFGIARDRVMEFEDGISIGIL